MIAINAKNSRFPSTLTLAFALFLTLSLTFVFSFREVRLKIGDYCFRQGKFDQAANWYEKAVRKGGLSSAQSRVGRLGYQDDLYKLKSALRQQGDYYLGQSNFDQAANWYGRLVSEERLKGLKDRGDRLKYEEDLSKLKLALHRQMEEKLLKVSQFLGFGQNKDLKSLLKDPKLFLKDIHELVGTEPKEELLNFDNISNNFKSLFGKKTDSKELDYLISIGYFFKGFIDEAEGNFMSANLNYEKASSCPEFSNIFSERREKNLSKMADEYSKRSPYFEKVGNTYVLLESEDPLIVTGVSPGPDNFLEYSNWPIKIVIQKYPVPRFRIQGEVLGGSTTSCIIPRIVFWGPKGYIGGTAQKYPVNGNFDICFPFSVPDGTVNVTPRISFDASCFSDGQKILIKEFKWH
jgi:tetratricopeptide (TPR) repeat protein